MAGTPLARFSRARPDQPRRGINGSSHDLFLPLLLTHASSLPRNNETVAARAVSTRREVPPQRFRDNDADVVGIAGLSTPARSPKGVRGLGWRDWDTVRQQLLAVVGAPPRIRTAPWTASAAPIPGKRPTTSLASRWTLCRTRLVRFGPVGHENLRGRPWRRRIVVQRRRRRGHFGGNGLDR
jgi:hypothetical protein